MKDLTLVQKINFVKYRQVVSILLDNGIAFKSYTHEFDGDQTEIRKFIDFGVLRRMFDPQTGDVIFDGCDRLIFYLDTDDVYFVNTETCKHVRTDPYRAIEIITGSFVCGEQEVTQ